MTEFDLDEEQKCVLAELVEYSTSDTPQNFFMMAGAGAGKTRLLERLVSSCLALKGSVLKGENRKIALITYTNVAANEIKARLGDDDRFWVGTTHGFAWESIKHFQAELVDGMKAIFATKIEQVANQPDEQEKWRVYKDQIRAVDYDQNAGGSGLSFNKKPGKYGASHEDVLNLFQTFCGKDVFSKIMAARFPIVYVDECQDTDKRVLAGLNLLSGPAVLEIPPADDNPNSANSRVRLGLFGDVMQKLYHQGADLMEVSLQPHGCNTVQLQCNHRSRSQIVELGNRLRACGPEDRPLVQKFAGKSSQVQESNTPEGTSRILYFQIRAPRGERVENPKQFENIESAVRNLAAETFIDKGWNNELETTLLVIEHYLAARRFGFGALARALTPKNAGLLYRRQRAETPGISMLSAFNWITRHILPLRGADQSQPKSIEDWEFLDHLSKLKNSPVYEQLKVEGSANKTEILQALATTKAEIDDVLSESNQSLRCVLKAVEKGDVFQMPKDLLEAMDAGCKGEWGAALDQPIEQYINAYNYLADKAKGTTIQGVKGLEMDKVFVAMETRIRLNTRAAAGEADYGSNDFDFLPKFGTGEPLTATERRNLMFLYVAVTRAKSSLVLLNYIQEKEDFEPCIEGVKALGFTEDCALTKKFNDKQGLNGTQSAVLTFNHLAPAAS